MSQSTASTASDNSPATVTPLRKGVAVLSEKVLPERRSRNRPDPQPPYQPTPAPTHLVVAPDWPASEVPQPRPAAPPPASVAPTVEGVEASRPVTPATASATAVAREKARLWGAMGMFQAVAQILAIRFILLLSVIGGFALGFVAMREQTMLSLWLAVVYNTSVIVPLVWLDLMGRRPQ